MNKKTMKIAGWALGLSLAVAGIGAAIGTSAKGAVETKAAVDLTTEEVNYTLSMKSNSSNSDNSTALSATTPGTYLASGTDYVSSVSSGYCYLGKSSYSSLKFGSSSKKGTITFTLASLGQVKATNLVFHFGAYDTGKRVNFSVNGKTSGTGYGYATTPSTQGNFTDYTLPWDGQTALTSITVEANVASSCRFYLASITVYTAKAVDPDAATVEITNNSNKLAAHGVAMPLSASITNDNNYSITWSCDNPNVTLSSTSGSYITITAPNTIAVGTKITVTATLDDPTSAYNVTAFRVSSVEGNSVANALSASEAKTLVSTGDLDGETLYVKGYANNSGAKLVWLSDSPDTTKTFEIYNAGGLSSYAEGTFIVAHGSALKYNTTSEVSAGVIDSADYFALGQTAVEVNNTQSVNVTASSASGDIVWNAVAGTGSVSLSNKSNTGVTITGTSVGTATVTATIGNLTKSITVTVAKYATDWAYKDIVLEADAEFQDGYYIGDELDTAHLTVTYIEHSATLDEDREHVIDLGLVTFNFDSSAAGSFNLTATYQGHTSDDVIPVTVAEAPDGIGFNSTASGLNISSSEPFTGSAVDSNGVTWNATATFSGTSSVSATAAHVQVGAKNKYADTVVITADMGSVKTFTKLAFKFNAFGNDTGTVSIKLDGNEVASGNIDGTNLVIVEPENYVRGQAVQIDVENEGSLRINLISVEYNAFSDDEMVTKFVNENMHMSHTTNDGSCTSQGWYTAAKTAYGKLFSQQKSLFNSESKYADAKARLIKWAEINEETFDPAAGTFSAAATFSPLSFANNAMPMVVTIAALGTAAAAGFFIFQRKRKEN